MTSASSHRPHIPAAPQRADHRVPPDPATDTIEADAVYHGWPLREGRVAVVIESPPGTYRPLPHRVLHSPAGFNCGYNGSGPRDLALSILTDALMSPSTSPSGIQPPARHESGPPPGAVRASRPDRDPAGALHLRFTEEVIARLPARRAWVLRRSDILRWLTTPNQPQPPGHSLGETFPAPPLSSPSSLIQRPNRVTPSTDTEHIWIKPHE